MQFKREFFIINRKDITSALCHYLVASYELESANFYFQNLWEDLPFQYIFFHIFEYDYSLM